MRLSGLWLAQYADVFCSIAHEFGARYPPFDLPVKPTTTLSLVMTVWRFNIAKPSSVRLTKGVHVKVGISCRRMEAI